MVEFLDLACRLIPGYELVSAQIRTQFEQSDNGKVFVNFVNQEVESINKKTSEARGVTTTLGYNEGHYLKEAVKKFQSVPERSCKNTANYGDLIHQITIAVIAKEYPDIAWLPADDQLQVAQHSLSQGLQKIPAIDRELKEQQEALDNKWLGSGGYPKGIEKSKVERQGIITTWKKTFISSSDMDPFRTKIVEQKTQACVNGLVRLFPGLKEPASEPENQSVADKLTTLLHDQYQQDMQQGEPQINEQAEALLTTFFFKYLQEQAQEINFIELAAFNKIQANKLAKTILNCSMAKILRSGWLAFYL